jgi:1,4-dihydroxy-2-naphthoate octaprenyltransferase
MTEARSDFLAALRPFSLVVALATCALGVSLALQDGAASPAQALLVILAGLLLQAGVNLINDHADLAHLPHDDAQRATILWNYRLGWVAIAVGCAIGFWFVWLRGWPMLLLGVLGVIGAWSYADGPVNFKARGLGVVAVFFLTGVLMVEGAYYALLGDVSLQVAWLSLPFSLYASLLLLANELRDYERDVRDGHRTFSVRYGYEAGAGLYRLLVFALFASTLVLATRAGVLSVALPLLALALLWLPLRILAEAPRRRASLTRLTGRCYFVFAVLFVGVLWLPAP